MSDLVIDAKFAQAFVDVNSPDHGYVRFEAAGHPYLFRLSWRAFVQLARDIQSEERRLHLQDQPQSPAKNQE